MNSLLWKRLLGRCWLTPAAKSRRLILIYHAVGRGCNALPTEQFSAQMEWLRAHCEVVSLDQLLQEGQPGAPASAHGCPGKPRSSTFRHSCESRNPGGMRSTHSTQVALTFDDGYACLYDTVAPILKEKGFAATVYLNTGWISASPATRRASDPTLGHYPDEHFLTWPEVQSLQQQGWTIGSHGVEHWDLTQQSLAIMASELSRSKADIEAHLGQPCLHFCYTWGRHSLPVRQAVQAASYATAVAAHHAPLSLNDDSFALPRMNIEKGYTLQDFAAVVEGRWDYLVMIQKLKQRLKRTRY